MTNALSRRYLLGAAGSIFAWAHAPRAASAAGARDPRLVVIVLRGALDGLATVAPVGDPDYAALHGPLALTRGGDHPGLPLDDFFVLNPGMPVFAKLFAAGEASIVHAVATGYRDRSHFDGQDVLESGMPGPGATTSGWLNRAMEALPSGGRVATGSLAVGAMTPLILRGAAPVIGWAPPVLPVASDDLASRVLALYRQADPPLANALAQGLGTDALAASGSANPKSRGGSDSPAGMRAAAEGAARLMAAPGGPRVAALVFDGWDTHAGEGGATGRLSQLLGGLDGAFDVLKSGLGPAWRDTAIVAITEFGRTARVNGTVGTDHGTGTVALLAGGALKGGRVIGDWPGLRTAQLYQNRDLAATTDLRSVLKGVLADQFGLSPATLATHVFPETLALKPMNGLIG